MITVLKAQKKVLDNCPCLPAERLPIEEATGRFVAKDIISPINMPDFHQSAMDGYAIKYSDLIDQSAARLKIAGEIKAGDSPDIQLGDRQAIRIFTGAPIPAGADSVVMQEKTNSINGNVKIKDTSVKQGANIRAAGTQLQKGKTALKKGTKLTPAAIGLLATMGFQEVPVRSAPRVGVLVTGSELKKPGQSLQQGEIYESNSYTLQAALQSVYIRPAFVQQVNDNEKNTLEALKMLIDEVDILITSGGISVGKYDFVRKALLALGTKEVFYKVAQKPGKPLFFGSRNKTLVFGLPGNPAAALTAFYEYIYPAVQRMQGESFPTLKKDKLTLLNEIHQKPNRACFYKGKINGQGVNILDGQQSFILKSFAEADCLVYVPKGTAHLKVWDKVEIHYLPS